MKTVHKKRAAKRGSYAVWHTMKASSAVHWAIFGVVVAGVACMFVFGSQNLFYAPQVSASAEPIVVNVPKELPGVTKPAAAGTHATTQLANSILAAAKMSKTDIATESAKADAAVAAATAAAAAAKVPVASTASVSVPAAPCSAGKCILVILSKQRIYAYENGAMIYTSLVSTGRAGHATPKGTFHIYGKTRSQKMSGPGYYLPNVPYILWFSGDYSLHGTYWHHNWGHVMSHGCVNLPTPVAKWFFEWAPVGTTLFIR